MTRIAVPPLSVRVPVPVEQPVYGWRYVTRALPNGTQVRKEIPLTAADVLHPQEGDTIPENEAQEQERGYLACVFRYFLRHVLRVLVTSDRLVNWGIPGLGDHSPDVAVFFGIRNRKRHRRKVYLAKEKNAEAVLAVEIVSPQERDPEARRNDVVHKKQHYHQAKVRCYVIVDQEYPDGPRRLVGYRYTPSRYEKMRLDKDNRFVLAPLGILLGLRDNRIVCYDADTGEEILDYAGQADARRLAEQRAERMAEQLRTLGIKSEA